MNIVALSNRLASKVPPLRLADQSGLRHILRDGTAWRGLDEAMIKGLRHVVRDGTAWG